MLEASDSAQHFFYQQHRNVFLKDSVLQSHSNRRYTKYIKVEAPGLEHKELTVPVKALFLFHKPQSETVKQYSQREGT